MYSAIDQIDLGFQQFPIDLHFFELKLQRVHSCHQMVGTSAMVELHLVTAKVSQKGLGFILVACG